jgi:hypothetical protein
LRAQRRRDDAGGKRDEERRDRSDEERGFPPKVQSGADSIDHDGLDASRDVRAGDARHAGQRRFHVQTTDVENALRVIARLESQPQHRFVARALALVYQPRADPPHERMEPEEGLDDHVDGGGEVVAARGVADFVRDDGMQLRRRQPVGDSRRHEEHRTPDADDARLQHARRRSRRTRSDGARHLDGTARANRGANSAPSPDANAGDDGEARNPQRGKAHRRQRRRAPRLGG